ncbi:hypothetical protein [Streptomyces bambusae]|uniref:hypothetical protein n=1 Tax=Streptomyces bambusae TaxID=1550616 RepID=UPI0021554A95|nr:hypothetical protein [Streptomyces bambusae]
MGGVPAQQQSPAHGTPAQAQSPQPVAPAGWFRDEVPSATAEPAAGDPLGTPYPQHPAAPEAPYAQHQAGPATPYAQHQAGPATPYAQQPAAAEAPYRQDPAAGGTPYAPQYSGEASAASGTGSAGLAAPEEWFRPETPAPDAAPASGPAWSQAAPQPATPWPATSSPEAAAETAYLPPFREGAASSSSGAAAETAYLPPVREGAAVPSPDAAAETAYLPPFRDGAAAPSPGAAAETAYLPPVREGAAVPSPDAAAETAYLPPFREGAASSSSGAAAETAYLPPFRDGAATPSPDAAAETAYLPPFREDAAAGVAAAVAAGEGAAPVPAPEDLASSRDSGYSEPTLAGSTRVIDPAQARAEGRSPIIDPGPQPALVTAGLGILMAGAAAVGEFALLLPLIALQGLTAAGWFRLNGMWPARQGIALAFAGAVTADVAVLAVDDAYGPGAVIGTLGVWVLLTLVLQLRSHADPDERMYGLMASVASAALAIVCAGYLAADLAAVTVGTVAVAVATFVRALPLAAGPSVGVSLAAAAGAGIAGGGLTDVGAAGGALLGLVAGVCALVGLRVAAYDYPSRFVHMTAGVALPLAAAAPAVYLIGRVVG